MEVIKNYDELKSLLARIANNMDQMTEIMKTEKQIKNTLYGISVARPLPDFDHINHLKDEIQDLKLENDRLKQRDAIMLDFIKSIDCTDRNCIRCMLNGENGTCKWTLFPYRVEMVNNVLKELEAL